MNPLALHPPPNPRTALLPKPRDGRFSWPHRLLTWLVLVLLLPVFTVGFIRAMLRKESNAATAFILTVYALADALLFFLLVGIHSVSLWSLLILAVGLAAAFIHNMYVALFVALRLETRT